MFLGSRRLSLNIHVDDWYAKSSMLDTHEAYRINFADFQRLEQPIVAAFAAVV